MTRSKEARELIKLVKAAGGTVEEPGPGKLWVHGPKGTWRGGDRVAAGRCKPKALKEITRYTGLVL